PLGNVVYSTYLGGSGDDVEHEISVDSSGSVYATGSTSSLNFPTTLDALQSVYGGGTTDIFVSALSSDGSSLAYSSYWGGSGHDDSLSIAVDVSNNVYFTGTTTSSNFPTLNPIQSSFGGGTSTQGDAFVTKISFGNTPLGNNISVSLGNGAIS